MHILLVTKDKGSFNFVEPGYRELIKRGHRVRIVAEGLSAELWQKTGAEIVSDGSALLHDIIVVGASSPINLEQFYADFANVNGIPLVIAEDSFGAANRVDGDAKLIVTINSISGRLIEKGRHGETPWKAVGSAVVAEPGVSPELQSERLRLTGGEKQLVLYAGQGGEFTKAIFKKMLELVSVDKTVIVLKHHPKFPMPDLERSDRFAESPFGSDDLARIADYTVSCFGTALNISAANGRKPICVWTPETAREFRKQTGLEEHPLYASGLVGTAITESWSLESVIWRTVTDDEREAARREISRKLDPSAFADAIEGAA
ncbi:hypothetical protein IT407_02980 [Candidatus Uhrbacteria bacterium]|nr:hypothetical protein [Candidatus Uhrbacteria bacterium]